ncbi:hypothetical protein, partial [Planktothrix serta]|uniref:hypothetical protein n=1 Tax=Planktothrix serta TaxID=1678310 RepID=UPI001E28A471
NLFKNLINQKPGFFGLGMVRALRLRTLRVGKRSHSIYLKNFDQIVGCVSSAHAPILNHHHRDIYYALN